MLENKSYFDVKEGKERGFGLTFAIFFIIIALYPILNNAEIHLWACIVAFTFLFLGFFFPKTLIIPNKLWLKFGMLLGMVVSPIVMGIIFFLVVTPTGIIMHLLGKDLLNQKLNKSKKSYWIKRKELLNSMKNQF